MKGLLLIFNYNHELEIRDVLERVRKAAPPLDILVVDDCSRDRSPQIASELGFQVLRHEVNRGIGAALRSGLNHALSGGYDFVTIMSANGKTRPEDLPNIYGPILSGEADYVTGSRYIDGGESPGLPAFRRYTIPMFSVLASALLGQRVTDVTCGFRAYRLDFLKNSQVNLEQEWLDRYEMEYYLHYWAFRLNLRIVEAPVTIEYRHLQQNRVSHIKPITGWWSMVRPLILLRLGLRN